MPLSPHTLATLRRVAVGSTIVAGGLLGGVALAQDGGGATLPTPSTEAGSTTTDAPATTVEPEAATPPGPFAPPIDPDDCPGCGMG